MNERTSVSGKEGTLSLRHVLLGLLSENSGHGYGLRKNFVHRLAHFRNINEGQLYTQLAKMEEEGLIEREVVVPEKGPARKLLHITPKGKELFQDWLRSDQYEEEGQPAALHCGDDASRGTGPQSGRRCYRSPSFRNRSNQSSTSPYQRSEFSRLRIQWFSSSKYTSRAGTPLAFRMP